MKQIARPEAGFLQQKNNMTDSPAPEPRGGAISNITLVGMQDIRIGGGDSPHNPSGIEPADVKVLVKPDAVEEKTAGGIILPDAAKEKEKYASMRGTLVAKGPNAFIEWGPSSEQFVPGVRVVTAQYAGRRVKGDDGEEYVVMNDEDVLGILTESSK